MYRSLLVPLDGTGYGEHALPVARGIARRNGATLHLVHVHTADPLVPGMAEGLPYLSGYTSPDVADGERAYLDDLGQTLAGDGEVRVETELVQGPLTESLERYAIERDAELVVACTHCHEGLSRFWHRGVGEQILHDVAIPILLIRSDESRPDLAREWQLRHVLVPLNGSPHAEEILDRAVPLARVFGARLTLLRVIRPMMLVGYTLLAQEAHVNHFLLEEQQQLARAYLERIAERLRAGGLEVGTRVVTGEEPARSIVESTRPDFDPGRPPVDLIAMTTHCRGPFARVVATSVTHEVLHDAPVPVLLHHPHAADGEEAVAGGAAVAHAAPVA